MSQIKELIEQIKEKRAEAAISVNDTDPRIRSGVEATVRNAQRDLPGLELQYKEAVMQHAIIIAVRGPGAEEFAKFAKYGFNTATVDFTAVKERMVKSLLARSARKEFSSQEYFIVLEELNKIKVECNALRLPMPEVNSPTAPIYDQPLAIAVEKLIENNYGGQLYSLVSRGAIGKVALDAEFVGKAMPVVLYNYKDTLDEGMLPRPIVIVDAPADVTDAFVKAQLGAVKTKLSGKNKTKTESEGE